MDSFLNASLRSVIDTAPLNVLAQLGRLAVGTRREAYGSQRKARKALTWNVDRAGRYTIPRGFEMPSGGIGKWRRPSRDVLKKSAPFARDYTQWATDPDKYDFRGIDTGDQASFDYWSKMASQWNISLDAFVAANEMSQAEAAPFGILLSNRNGSARSTKAITNDMMKMITYAQEQVRRGVLPNHIHNLIESMLIQPEV